MADRIYDNLEDYEREDYERDRALRRWDAIHNEGGHEPNGAIHYTHKLIDIYSDEISAVAASLDNINGDYNDLDRDGIAELRHLMKEDELAMHLTRLVVRLLTTAVRIGLLVECGEVAVLADDLRDALGVYDISAVDVDDADERTVKDDEFELE